MDTVGSIQRRIDAAREDEADQVGERRFPCVARRRRSAPSAADAEAGVTGSGTGVAGRIGPDADGQPGGEHARDGRNAVRGGRAPAIDEVLALERYAMLDRNTAPVYQLVAAKGQTMSVRLQRTGGSC